MIRSILTGIAVTAITLFSVTAAANADHILGSYDNLASEEELIAVEWAINAGEYGGKRAPTDMQSMLNKLGAAAAKIDLGKISGGIAKLGDISDKAEALALDQKKGIPKLADDTDIVNTVGDAMECLMALDT